MESYLAGHLVIAEHIDDGIDLVRCPQTRLAWLALTFEIDVVGRPPTILRVIEPAEPERVGVYL